MISLGDTYWARNPNSNNPPHLYFVITDPKRNQGRVLLVNMTERKAGSDGSCILRIGDHPRVTKESVLQYAEAILPDGRRLEEVVNRGLFTPAERAAMPLVRRMLAAALRSPHLRKEYRAMVEAEITALGPAS